MWSKFLPQLQNLMGFLLQFNQSKYHNYSELKILVKILLTVICTHMVDFCMPGHICSTANNWESNSLQKCIESEISGIMSMNVLCVRSPVFLLWITWSFCSTWWTKWHSEKVDMSNCYKLKLLQIIPTYWRNGNKNKRIFCCRSFTLKIGLSDMSNNGTHHCNQGRLTATIIEWASGSR